MIVERRREAGLADEEGPCVDLDLEGGGAGANMDEKLMPLCEFEGLDEGFLSSDDGEVLSASLSVTRCSDFDLLRLGAADRSFLSRADSASSLDRCSLLAGSGCFGTVPQKPQEDEF